MCFLGSWNAYTQPPGEQQWARGTRAIPQMAANTHWNTTGMATTAEQKLLELLDAQFGIHVSTWNRNEQFYALAGAQQSLVFGGSLKMENGTVVL